MKILLFLLIFISNYCFGNPTEFTSETNYFSYDNYERLYSIYVPEKCFKIKKNALVIALHGGGGSIKKWPVYTNNGFEHLAQNSPFILVYPEALEGNWNDERNIERYFSQKNKINDLGFLSSLIDYLIDNYPVDRNKVFVLGVSNGGLMAHYLALKHSDKIAAIAAVIASIPVNLKTILRPVNPISVLMINGTDDPLVLWNGGTIKLGKKACGDIISVDDTLKFWIKNNHCNTTPEIIEFPDLDPKDNTRVKKSIYSKGDFDTEVVLYTIIGGGHTWPAYKDTRKPLLKLVVDEFAGIKSKDIDACEIIWDFFRTHPKRISN
ncbi:MAG: phospholipase/carboxylesterase [uncultured bacterium]|nr:MAG: phospholipase/carboxylesterase [uncultured bacterium]